MARTGTLDPLSVFRFVVHIQIDGNPDSFQRLGFQSITSPRVDIQKQQYREMGRHLSPRNLVEGAIFSPVTLRRGKSYSLDFYNWMGKVYRAFYGSEDGSNGNYRANIVIDHHDRSGAIIKKYVLIGASPITYIPSSNFNAEDDTSLSIETLMLDYEGYLEVSVDTYSALQAAAGEAAAALNGQTTRLEAGFTSEVLVNIDSINSRKPANF